MTSQLPQAAAPPDQAPADDPYRYGWRYIRRDLPNGDYELDRVPLSLADVLHPQEEDFIVHTFEHEACCTYLQNVLQSRLAHDPTAVVLRDVRVSWDLPELKPHGPDIAVIFGVRERRNWSTFDVAREGVRPALVIEVTSPETRRNDLYDKLIEYDQAGVAFYIIVDAHERRGTPSWRLLGYQSTPDGYVGLPPNEHGWLWMEPVRLWIGLHNHHIECYNEAGNPIGDYVQVKAALTEMEARTAAEAHAREVAEARAAEAEARASAAETRLRELEQELRRLRDD